ncbi:hypothetical protein D9599_29390, partial [Roseomonas sp. KE2513]|nr:hypothetical protein [Roseomonas sp. KE2513]
MKLRWVKEPIGPPEDTYALAEVRRTGGCAIAAGENLGSVGGFAYLLRAGAVDIVQPSAARYGLSALTRLPVWPEQLAARSCRTVPTLDQASSRLCACLPRCRRLEAVT